MQHYFLSLFILSSLWSVSAAMAGSNVNLNTGKAYLSLPKSSDPAPAILIVHDDSGVDAFIKEEVDRWAERGFVVLAVDLYQGTVAENLQAAARLRDRLDSEFAEKMMSAALKYLRESPRVDKPRVGVLAFGMGADRALAWARSQEGVRLWILYDVQPDLDVKHLQKIAGRVLAVYAAQDAALPEKLVSTFEKQLKEAQINFEIKKFPAKGSKYWDYTKAKLYEPKPSQEAREFLQNYFEKFLTLSDHRK